MAYDSYALSVDDFSFEAAGDFPADLDIVGYHVYRNCEKLSTAAPVAEEAYADADVPAGPHTYHVTTVYNYGESLPSEGFTVNHVATGVSSAATASGISVEAASGAVLVKGAEGLAVSVATPSGVVLHSSVAEQPALSVAVSAPGIYLVTVGNSAFKVAVTTL